MWTELTRGARNVFTIAQRELFAFFVSPVAYAVVAFQFAACTFIMFQISAAEGPVPVYQEDMARGVLWGAAPIIFFWIRFTAMLTFPLLTMRLFAEERRTGTIEMLLTSPVRDVEVVLGKFFGACTLLLVTVAFALVHMFWFHRHGGQEWPQMLAGLLGYTIAGASFLAIGLFISSLTRSQITACLGTLGALFLLWMVGWGAGSTEGTKIGAFLEYVSLDTHLDDFLKGIIDARAFAYFGALTVFALFGTVRSLAGHRAQ